MSTNGSNALDKLLEIYKDNEVEISNSNKIIYFNNYLESEERRQNQRSQNQRNQNQRSQNQRRQNQRRQNQRNQNQRNQNQRNQNQRSQNQRRQNQRSQNQKEHKVVTKSTKPREETKTKIKTPTPHSNKRSYTGNKKQRVAAWAAVAIMFFAGKGIISNINTQDEQVNASTQIEMALKNGANLETLGIDDTIFTEIKEIEGQLANDDLTNIEILKLAPRINAVYFDVVKGKLANTLGVKKHDVKIYADTDHEGKPTQRIEVSDGRIYINEDFLTNKNTFSEEISGAINGIASMQGTLSKLDFDNINREELIKELTTILNNAGEFASYKIEIDENGRISARPFTRDDLDQYDKAVYDSINKSTIDQQNDMDER